MGARTPIVGGNWKMNTDLRSASDLARGVADGVAALKAGEVVVFPPFPYLFAVGAILRERQSAVRLGAQDVSQHPDGAYTGEVSVAMLRDCGVRWVLAGHSERRHVLGETDDVVRAKVSAALAGGLSVILCVGETLSQRERGQTDEVNTRQIRAGLSEVSAQDMARVVIAYEPVWAIGTGKTATPGDAQAAHARIRSELSSMFGAGVAAGVRIQYGGSVKGSNARELMGQADIDGGLIGGASLKAAEFVEIVRATG